MNKLVFHYAVLRFMPNIDTREFANVGLVLVAPDSGKFVFKLAPERFTRIIRFFGSSNEEVYRESVALFSDELNRFQKYCLDNGLRGNKLAEQFREQVRLRESVIYYSPIGTMIGEHPEKALIELYERLVMRAGGAELDTEHAMARSLRNDIAEKFKISYAEQVLSVDSYDITLPLVHKKDKRYSVIQPLAFEQENALTAIEHAETWLRRIKRLVENRVLQPEWTLFTLKMSADSAFDRVYADVRYQISAEGLQVCNYDEMNTIRRFAAKHLE